MRAETLLPATLEGKDFKRILVPTAMQRNRPSNSWKHYGANTVLHAFGKVLVTRKYEEGQSTRTIVSPNVQAWAPYWSIFP